MRAFWAAVSLVNGGNGGRDMKGLLVHECRKLNGARGSVERPFVIER
jgi:hypothetical protein